MQSTDRRRALYDYSWLKHRVSMSFDTLDNCKKSITFLRMYINTGPEHDPEINRVYRVRDLIHSQINILLKKKVTEQVSEIDKELAKFATQLDGRWSQIEKYAFFKLHTDAEHRRELQAAYSYSGSGRAQYNAIKAWVEKRFRNTKSELVKEEARWYLSLMDSVDGSLDTAPPQGEEETNCQADRE